MREWLLGGFGALFALALSAQEVSREYQLKAVFLCRFAQFVEWPEGTFASPESPVVIGILGSDPFGGYLEKAIRGERVGNRRITIEHFQRPQQALNCQVLFISPSEGASWPAVLNEVRGRRILTVGENAGFAPRGGMIQFVTEHNHIRFRINLEAARAGGLQISSKLLELAEVVNAHKD